MKTLFILLCFSFLAIAAKAQPKDSQYDEAYELYQNNKYEEAMRIIDSLIDKDSSSANYYDLRGSLHFELGNKKHSFFDYSRAIYLKPNDPIYYHHRAILFYSWQMPDESIEDNNNALKYVQNNDSLKYGLITNRGNAKLMKRDFAGAYEDYTTALKFDSTNIAVLINLGAISDDLGRHDEVMKYLNRALKLDPTNIGVYGNLGFMHMNKGNYAEAMRLFNKVIELDAREPLTYNNRGFVKYKMNDMKGALTDINRSLELYPSNSFAYKNRALVYIQLKQFVQACKDLKRAKELGFTEMYGNEVEELLNKHCQANQL